MSTQKDEIFEEIFDDLSTTLQDLEKDEVKEAFERIVSKKNLFSNKNAFREEQFEKLLNDVEVEMMLRRMKPLTEKQESRFVDRIIKTIKNYPHDDILQSIVYSEMLTNKFNPRPDDVVRQDVESRIKTYLARKESLKEEPRDLTKERVLKLFGNAKKKEIEMIYGDYKTLIEKGIVSEIRKKKDLLKNQLDECKESCKNGCVEHVMNRKANDEKMNKKSDGGGRFWEKYMGRKKNPTKEELLQEELEKLGIPNLEDIDTSSESEKSTHSTDEESNDNTDADSTVSPDNSSSHGTDEESSNDTDNNSSHDTDNNSSHDADNNSSHDTDEESSKRNVSLLKNPVEYLKDENKKYKYENEKKKATKTCKSLFEFAEDRMPHGFPHSICSMEGRISSKDTVQKCRIATILQKEIEQVFKLYKDDIERNESQIAMLKSQFSKLRNSSFRGGLLKKTKKRRR
jgi:hypothetical protein